MYKQRDSLLLQKSIIHNAEGYTQYTYTGASDSPKPMQYYFHKDHLGNVCAVWNATTDEVVQRTNYYPSGVPMAQSTGQSVQPLKYNAHEYIEAYGYDVYDYGFRGYYATIGRFTSIDPLCERTPWQSPYAYANNNWINQIDIFGLAGVNLSVPRLNWVAVDKNGNVQGWGTDNNDYHVYEIDDDWDKTYEGLSKYDIIGWEIPGWTNYVIGRPCYYLGSFTTVFVGRRGLVVVGKTRLMYGKKAVTRNVDNTFEAVAHYFFGAGESIALGDNFTKRRLLTGSEFQEKRSQILSGELAPIGHVSINMTTRVFHIGHTTMYYYSGDGYIVFSIGAGDSFSDPLSSSEKSRYFPFGKEGDHMGPELELSTPYLYIPMAVLVPNSN